VAQRSDRLKALARHRAAEVDIKCPVAIKRLTLSLRPYREVTDEKGRVFKVCGVLECSAKLAGMLDAIEIEADVEIQESFGVAGEIDQGIRPAVEILLAEIKRLYVAYKDAKQEKPGRTVKPLFSDRGLDVSRSERMKAMNAKRAAERAAQKQAQADAETDAASEEGGGS